MSEAAGEMLAARLSPRDCGEGAELAAEIVARSSGRTITEEWRDYPEEGFWRPAKRLLWYVVRESDGSEVTRDLRHETAELYL